MKLSKRLRNGLIMVMAIVVSISVISCGTTQKPASDAETSKLASKLSGKLTVYSAGPSDLAINIQKGFEKKTGVQVEMFQGTTGKILSRLEAEKAKPVADVVVLASLASAQGLKKSGMTLPYKPYNVDKLFPQWSDNDGNYYSYSLSALGIAYNTKLVANPPKDWIDLSKLEWKDKVNIPDPALSGSALDFATGYLSVKGDSGWDLFKQLKNNGVLMAGANQEALDPVITGAKSMVIASVDYMTYQAKAKGEPVDLIYPAEGTVISARPALILKTSNNADNAKAFMDYLLSDEVQKMVADAYLLPGRSDVKVQGRPSASEIPTLKINSDWMIANEKSVIQQFTDIFKK